MADDQKSCRNSAVAGSIAGPIWFIGWLFTVGFASLPFWKAVLALIIWPYLLGAYLR
ncbi:MAG: hypothetical protein NTX17_01360 [Candidatus Eisenbacteria bacterium]|nr:hypothetical protein [Candidatus Eisenbacteria bacterium]